jgi:hypothetical protein
MYPSFLLSYFWSHFVNFSSSEGTNKVFAKSFDQSILNASLQPIVINIIFGFR